LEGRYSLAISKINGKVAAYGENGGSNADVQDNFEYHKGDKPFHAEDLALSIVEDKAEKVGGISELLKTNEFKARGTQIVSNGKPVNVHSMKISDFACAPDHGHGAESCTDHIIKFNKRFKAASAANGQDAILRVKAFRPYGLGNVKKPFDKNGRLDERIRKYLDNAQRLVDEGIVVRFQPVRSVEKLIEEDPDAVFVLDNLAQKRPFPTFVDGHETLSFHPRLTSFVEFVNTDVNKIDPADKDYHTLATNMLKTYRSQGAARKANP